MAVKASLKNNRISQTLINTESKMFKKISASLSERKCVPEFWGDSFFDDTFIIKMEFVDQSIEEAIEDKKKPYGYTSALLGMFDGI